MGDIAEAMLDGTFCEECGDVFDDVLEGKEPPGYPRKCRACDDANAPEQRERKQPARKLRKGRRP